MEQFDQKQKWYKYPRTYHFPCSPGATNDDRILSTGTYDVWNHEVVISEKLDGEGTNFYCDGWHVRSLDFEAHPSRNRIAALHATIASQIPYGWRFCVENLTAKHSIYYTDLPAICEVFGLWNGDTCLSWDDTVTYSALIGLNTVPVIYRGMWDYSLVEKFAADLDSEHQEGFVVRPTASFQFKDFNTLVGKWVRKNHIQSDSHWMRQKVVYNGIRINTV